jgi:hypothetical protein
MRQTVLFHALISSLAHKKTYSLGEMITQSPTSFPSFHFWALARKKTPRMGQTLLFRALISSLGHKKTYSLGEMITRSPTSFHSCHFWALARQK